MSKVLNWAPVIESFAAAIVAGGFELDTALDGEGGFKDKCTPKEAGEWVAACDEGHINFTKDGNHVDAYIVLGNDPDEIVADWGYNNNDTEEEFDKLWSDWMEDWGTKPCPTKEV